MIVRLLGGLGNQMFQYAFGEKLKAKYGFDVKYDITYLKADSNNTGRNLELLYFDIDSDKFGELSVRHNFLSKIKNRLFSMGLKFIELDYLVERMYFYDASLEDKIKSHTYCVGYWQDQRYFSEWLNLDEIFTPKFDIDFRPKENSVSVHIRAGDYRESGIHCLQNETYYTNAIEYLKKRIGSPFFYIFTNDANYACNLATKLDCEYEMICDNGFPAAYDLMMMSMCEHNIISNSSYSWWAACLNKNKNKTVVAPKRWYVTTSSPLQHSDFISILL